MAPYVSQQQDLKGKTVLITGASAGIGKGLAFGFAKLECNLILIARRSERLQEIKSQIEKDQKVKILVLSVDLSSLEQIQNIPKQLPPDFQNVDILINNAGLGIGGGPIDQLNIEKALATFNVNVNALLVFTRLFTPGMKERNFGHVVNISSRAAEHHTAGGSTYQGTKHAVKAISEASRRDLVDTAIRVTEIRPGLVETEFFDQLSDSDRKAFFKRFQPLSPEDVTETVLFAATRLPHVQVNVITL